MIARFIAVFLLLIVMASCSGSSTVGDSSSNNAELPALSELDNLRGPSALSRQDIGILSPLSSHNTSDAGSTLALNAPAGELAYAIYRVEQSAGQPVQLHADCEGKVWLTAADFGRGRWAGFTPAQGSASLALGGLADSVSPGGYHYFAVVCEPESGAVLKSLSLDIEEETLWEITATPQTDPPGITVEWNGELFGAYDIYRSTMEHDSSPYHIGTVSDGPGRLQFFDPVNIIEGGEWLPANNDRGTVSPLDDYPTIAPAVEYWYFVTAAGAPASASPVTSATVDWDNRRSSLRLLPESDEDVQVFADQLRPDLMSPEQVQWCAENLVGTQKIFRRQAEEFRQHNPQFMVLGYHLGLGAGNIGNVHGDSWDADSDWPYADRHNEWFLSSEESSHPNQRILQQDWNWYGAWPMGPETSAPLGLWNEYLADNLLQMLGEDHFDGWFIDSTSELWNTDPAQWWPGDNTSEAMFAFWQPEVQSLLDLATLQAAAHPLSPLVIPNAGYYVTTASNLDYLQCDGIMIEGHARWSPGNYFSADDWRLQQERIFEHQQAGLSVILQSHVDLENTHDRAFNFATFLLLRSEKTYINWLAEGEDSSIGQWFPEFEAASELGKPYPLPDEFSGLEDGFSQSGIYKRKYENGYVIVNPRDLTAINYGPPGEFKRLVVSGGGNVTGAGTPEGTYSWADYQTLAGIPPYGGIILLNAE